jgi:hypothetical protein
MATGVYTDLKINEDHFFSGLFEEMEQIIEGIVSGSQGAIIMEDTRIKGHYSYEEFFPAISNLVTRRDISAVTDATVLKMTEDERIGVKLNRKAGPVEMTLDSFKKKNLDPARMSFWLGGEFAKRKAQEMINTALLACASALEGQAALTKDVTGESSKTLTHGYLNAAYAKRGDKAGEIVSVMVHSKPHYDLVGQAITDKITDVAGIAVNDGMTAYLGRRPLVTDSSALTDANGSATDTYNTLGLVPGAIVISASEPEDLVFELVSGKENLIYRFQAEYAYNVEVKGFKWDVSNGGVNPNAAAIGTASNWDQVETSDKTLAGVLLVSQ